MTKQPLTDRQREVLDYIQGHIKNAGYPPTRIDVAKHFDFRSPNAAQDHLEALERKGWIRIVPRIARGITIC